MGVSRETGAHKATHQNKNNSHSRRRRARDAGGAREHVGLDGREGGGQNGGVAKAVGQVAALEQASGGAAARAGGAAAAGLQALQNRRVSSKRRHLARAVARRGDRLRLFRLVVCVCCCCVVCERFLRWLEGRCRPPGFRARCTSSVGWTKGLPRQMAAIWGQNARGKALPTRTSRGGEERDEHQHERGAADGGGHCAAVSRVR